MCNGRIFFTLTWSCALCLERSCLSVYMVCSPESKRRFIPESMTSWRAAINSCQEKCLSVSCELSFHMVWRNNKHRETKQRISKSCKPTVMKQMVSIYRQLYGNTWKKSFLENGFSSLSRRPDHIKDKREWLIINGYNLGTCFSNLDKLSSASSFPCHFSVLMRTWASCSLNSLPSSYHISGFPQTALVSCPHFFN